MRETGYYFVMRTLADGWERAYFYRTRDGWSGWRVIGTEMELYDNDFIEIDGRQVNRGE